MWGNHLKFIVGILKYNPGVVRLLAPLMSWTDPRVTWLVVYRKERFSFGEMSSLHKNKEQRGPDE